MKTENSCLWWLLLFSGAGTSIAIGMWIFEYFFGEKDTPEEYDNGYEDGYTDGYNAGYENRYNGEYGNDEF